MGKNRRIGQVAIQWRIGEAIGAGGGSAPFPLLEARDEADGTVPVAVEFGSWWVVVRLAEIGGRMEPVSVDVRAMPAAEGRQVVPLAGSKLRLPFTTIFQAAAQEWYRTQKRAAEIEDDASFPPVEPLIRAVREDARTRLPAAQAGTRPVGGGRPPKYGPEHFRRVAEVYDEALAAGLPPTAEVRKQFKTTRAAAPKWVAEARKLGFLGKTKPRRAGGRLTKKGREGGTTGRTVRSKKKGAK